MIYDRTQADVDAAKKIISDKIQQSIDVTAEETETLERGTLTINTLNRIENKCAEVKKLMLDLCYGFSDIETEEWTYEQYFRDSDFERISDNVGKLKNAFFSYSDTPSAPGANFRKFENINAVEKILFDLETMINEIKSNYRECGTFECDEEERYD